MERKIWCTLLEGILKAVHFNVTHTNIKIYQIPTPIDFLKQSLELKNSDLIGVETNQEQEAWLGLWALIYIYCTIRSQESQSVSHFHHANIPHKFLIRAKCIGVMLGSDCLFSWCISHRASLVYDQTIVCAVGAIDVAACPLSVTKDIWSHWWEDMTKKIKKTNTNTMKFEMTMAACPVVSTKDSALWC